MIYLIILLLLLLGILIECKNKKKGEIYFKVMLIILTLLTGFRKNIGGTDYWVYKAFYNYPLNYNPWNYDYLFLKLKEIGFWLNLNYNQFLFFIAIISHLIIYQTFKKYTKYLNFTLLSFFLNNYLWQNFTILRSSLSIYILWLSLKFIINKEKFKYICSWILMVGFHRTSIPLIIIYSILDKIKIKKTKKILCLSLMIGVIVPIYFTIIPIKIIKINLIIGFFIVAVKKCIEISIFYKIYPKVRGKYKGFFYKLYLCSVNLSIIFATIPAGTRYSHYFMLGKYIFLSYMFEEFLRYKNKKIKLGLIAIFSLDFFIFFISILSDLYRGYENYLFF